MLSSSRACSTVVAKLSSSSSVHLHSRHPLIRLIRGQHHRPPASPVSFGPAFVSLFGTRSFHSSAPAPMKTTSMPSDNDVVIVAARRSPVGKFGGSLSTLSAADLGAVVLQQCLRDLHDNSSGGFSDNMVDEVIIGQVLTAGCGQNPARQTAIKAGLPEAVPSYTINKVCGSGLKAVGLAAQGIRAGDAEVVVAGGQESMSLAPHVAELRKGKKMGPITMVDSMVHDGLICAFNKYHMGITAENVVTKYSLTRAAQDDFALQSQQKALAAQRQSHFSPQIVPIPIPGPGGKKSDKFLDQDEYINVSASKDGMAKLKPAFKKDGTVTAGNASGLNDGAAFTVVTTRSFAKKLSLPVLATVRGFAAAGLDPSVMGLGPIFAVKKLMKKINWQIPDVELWESNEAFASQSLGVAKELGLDMAKVNVNGGAIALGHPIGASGTRILVDLVYELKRRGKKRGVATMCIGGGQGVALAVEAEGAEAPAAKL